jgi:hypothetical protein
MMVVVMMVMMVMVMMTRVIMRPGVVPVAVRLGRSNRWLNHDGER